MTARFSAAQKEGESGRLHRPRAFAPFRRDHDGQQKASTSVYNRRGEILRETRVPPLAYRPERPRRKIHSPANQSRFRRSCVRPPSSPSRRAPLEMKAGEEKRTGGREADVGVGGEGRRARSGQDSLRPRPAVHLAAGLGAPWRPPRIPPASMRRPATSEAQGDEVFTTAISISKAATSTAIRMVVPQDSAFYRAPGKPPLGLRPRRRRRSRKARGSALTGPAARPALASLTDANSVADNRQFSCETMRPGVDHTREGDRLLCLRRSGSRVRKDREECAGPPRFLNGAPGRGRRNPRGPILRRSRASGFERTAARAAAEVDLAAAPRVHEFRGEIDCASPAVERCRGPPALVAETPLPVSRRAWSPVADPFEHARMSRFREQRDPID